MNPDAGWTARTESPAGAIRLRAHHLICLFAFSGEGYSADFTRRFDELRTAYLKSDTLVEVLVGPDDACDACPHLTSAGCGSTEDGPESSVRTLDSHVLQTLSLTAGRHAAGDLHKKVFGLTPDQLSNLCQPCTWYGRMPCQEKVLAYSRKAP